MRYVVDGLRTVPQDPMALDEGRANADYFLDELPTGNSGRLRISVPQRKTWHPIPTFSKTRTAAPNRPARPVLPARSKSGPDRPFSRTVIPRIIIQRNIKPRSFRELSLRARTPNPKMYGIYEVPNVLFRLAYLYTRLR